MVKIGIIGAMDEEIMELKKYMTHAESVDIAGIRFYDGKLFDKECVVVKSGVGKVFSAMTAQILIDKFNVGKIIFTGLAGSINKDIHIGDIVVGERAIQYDMDASQLGCKIGQILYTDYQFFYSDKKMVDTAMKTKIAETNIFKGTILTGDSFLSHDEQKKRSKLFNEFKGDCLEMEGAAVAQVCTLNNVPFVIIRIMSDNADESAVKDFEKFKGIVSHKSIKIVENIVRS